MQPAEKSEGMERTITTLLGYDRRVSIEEDKCVSCGGVASWFRDALSAKEFSISGLCQKC